MSMHGAIHCHYYHLILPSTDLARCLSSAAEEAREKAAQTARPLIRQWPNYTPSYLPIEAGIFYYCPHRHFHLVPTSEPTCFASDEGLLMKTFW